MRLIETRTTLQITPSNVIDVAYMEEVLGLKKDGDTCVCTRFDKSLTLGHIEISKEVKK